MQRESVVRLLCGSPPIAELAAEEITATNAWVECIHLANAWGVLPRIAERAAQRSWQLPPSELSEISSHILKGYVRSVLEAESGLAVLEHFRTADLPGVAFKGLASMACLYSDVKA